MKKNGFIAMSLIYTFFIVFVVVQVSILDYYLDNNAIVEKINDEVITRYNEGLDGKELVRLYEEGTIKRADFISYQTNTDAYNNGQWQVLKADGDGVYILSRFIVSYLTKYAYMENNIRTIYSADLLNIELASDIYALQATDLWSSYLKSSIDSNNPEYSMWNIGTQYFVSDNSYIKVVAPNCSCSGTRGYENNTAYYAISLPQQLTLAEWYTTFCSQYVTSSYEKSILSECPIRYLKDEYNIETLYKSGARIVIKLRENAILIGGAGSIGNPYLIGVVD